MRILFASTSEPLEAWRPLLAQALPHDELVLEPDPSVEVALVAKPPAGTLSRLRGAKLIQSLWMGVDGLLADPELPRGVPLARLVDPGMVAAMTESVLAHVLDWHRHLYRYREQQRAATWRALEQRLAADRTVGILGLGALGAAAARGLAALGFRVAGWSRRPKAIPGVHCTTRLEELLPISDALVCLLPLTSATRGILDARAFSRMPAGGCLINLARGAHVVVPDLLAALASGHLAHAYLDVFEREPLPPADPLWSHPGVTITPHIAALTEPRTALPKVVANIERVRRGETPLDLVDRQAGY
ncbi:MAG TPA: glyoxylate/hydroxypyruvate reductase A [Burkholderiales bacterium]|nr:glyoxylate/hydroxypyruvate reductase A [Burkholderiales bacterium]